MPEFTAQSRLGVPAEEVFAWHERPGTLERLIPGWSGMRILERSGGIRNGGRVVLLIRQGPLRFRWVARHGSYEANRQFCDEQVEGPFPEWLHVHDFIPEERDRCLLRDHIRYRLPLGPLGSLAAGRNIRKNLTRVFIHRHRVTRDDLIRHRRFAGHGPTRIVVSGASGLVGRALCAFLCGGGHHVERLVRRTPRPGEPEIGWDPDHGRIDRAALQGVDAVINLAGENIAAGRWTPQRKRAILDSRILSTALLARTLADLDPPPRVFVSVSAVGYYGDRGDEPVDEASLPGSGFLADVCRKWEAATEPARDAGIRVANLRIAMVLAGAGGALPRMVTPFKLGLGGVIGNGRQYMSWIALEDLLGCIEHVIHHETLAGPINATSPEPAPNRLFVRTLADLLRRPAVARMPAVLVKLLFGEMGSSLLLSGARVIPRRLQTSGFAFLYPDLVSALGRELGLFNPRAEQATRGTEIHFA